MMRIPASRFAGALLFCAPILRSAADPIDDLGDALSVSAFQDSVRGQLSGTMDLEGYDTGQPSPGFIRNDGSTLFVPRLSVFLDGQLGPDIYVFSQTRVDEGFDPGNGGSLRPRMDEYVVRFTPSRKGVFNLQLGKFATIVGNWTPRHDSWSDPFVTAPLPYDNLTGIWDAFALRSTGTLLEWAQVSPSSAAEMDKDKALRLPILWGPSYTAGAAVSGEVGWVEYALEVKNASLSSRPESWSHTPELWDDPTVSAHIAVSPDEKWNFGLSASEGPYLRQSAIPTVPAGESYRNYRETVFGEDASFAWHHFQAWAEIYEARFEIPAVANADTLAYYLEAKYKITPQFSWALRWNQQLYGTVFVPQFVSTGGSRPSVPSHWAAWGRDLWRIDSAPSYRITPHIQLKLQATVEEGDADSRGVIGMLATQLTLRF
jgi:hypothetical protein